MKILKVISLLLDYPTELLVTARDELDQAIANAREISPAQRNALHELLELICENDLMDGQEHYGALFGRGRSLSLLLFEHVHGESRDRGQAMVDMMAQYEAAGFAICTSPLYSGLIKSAQHFGAASFFFPSTSVLKLKPNAPA